MVKQKTIDVWIDKLTNSIVNTISGDSLPTHIIEYVDRRDEERRPLSEVLL
jgi:hypothetical protein